MHLWQLLLPLPLVALPSGQCMQNVAAAWSEYLPGGHCGQWV
ncbi:MAG TPA: hypothetical protein VGT02_04065 [Methylomirabilota bacterium]|nr:hypothetical protein [Methylomirabilota bacterium]